MLMREMPVGFTRFDDARRAGFVAVAAIRDTGRRVVGTYCVFAPTELILAAGALPVSLCAMSGETIPAAEAVLPRNLCPLIKSSYGFALTDKCPYFYFADLIVAETTCDGKKKMYEYLGELKPLHLLRLPHGTDAVAVAGWRAELVLLKERLEREFAVTITDEAICAAIRQRNAERAALLALCAVNTARPAPLTGLALHQVLYGAGFRFDKPALLAELGQMTATLRAEAAAARGTGAAEKRILVTGVPLGGATEKVIRLIAEAGGSVVAYENCTGLKEIIEPVAETGDPLTALAEKYLRTACSCMSPNRNRLDLLTRLIDEYAVAGVIDVVLQACHTYAVESRRICDAVTARQRPYLCLETDFSTADTEQLKNRIAAFVEML